MTRSMLFQTLAHLNACSGSAVVAQSRIASTALNAAMLRRLSVGPGQEGALLNSPIFESAPIWRSAPETLNDLSGSFFDPRLVTALDTATKERMPRSRHPYTHQLAAWRAAKEGLSCLVTSGTGSGKTECFMLPMLDDLLNDPAQGKLEGVRAIVVYPLNALIESQRERLSAWTEQLSDRITFALYNRDTPEIAKQQKRILSAAEIGDRKTLRARPPSILITNVTMLEYLLLRHADQPVLAQSQGLLRWIVLDEAHSYIGAQAAEMALLLRRVRNAFGVAPEQVRVMATSATISDGGKAETHSKLEDFIASLAGTDKEKVGVIHGAESQPALPDMGQDRPLDPATLEACDGPALWAELAPHPRIRNLRHKMRSGGINLPAVSELLYGERTQQEKAQSVLDIAAQTKDPCTGEPLLPWRAHIFHRALGGLWVCINPTCSHRDAELTAPEADWGFGAVWLEQRERCQCGSPVFELQACSDCGTPFLVARKEVGMHNRLLSCQTGARDEFLVDMEPDPDTQAMEPLNLSVWLRPATGTASDRLVCLDTGTIYDNTPPQDTRTVALNLISEEKERGCCAGAERAMLRSQHFGPSFFMGAILPDMAERLAPPLRETNILPMEGRRAITFSDSRQGVARLAAKLQQDAERSLTRACIYHSVQRDDGMDPAARKRQELFLQKMKTMDPVGFADQIAETEQELSQQAKAIPWETLVITLAQQDELRQFATQVWAERDWGGRDLAEDPTLLAQMFLYRELFRRPRVQNNVETMGLARLVFPAMEAKTRLGVPHTVKQAGIEDTATWAGLAQTAVDFVFREQLAVHLPDEQMIRWILPRRAGTRKIYNRDNAPADAAESHEKFWVSPRPHQGRVSRFQKLLYRVIKGDPNHPADQERARDVLDALWSLIITTAARDSGRGGYQLDYEKAALARVDQGWLCPVTRRIFGYTTGEASPYDPDDTRPVEVIDFPRLPCSNPGGLDPQQRAQITQWCDRSADVEALRRRGLWTNLHDKAATYPPFFRSQEHSAQIDRAILQRYEDLFRNGEINFLNCSTTMEMGVDIPNVTLVGNSNVPPAIANYRQRIGRAGRRGEPWAFGVTFCRDLPLDHVVFRDPQKFLNAMVAAPAVRLHSRTIVIRHVHAALLGRFLRQNSGVNINERIGTFFGERPITDAEKAPFSNQAQDFILALRDPAFMRAQEDALRQLTRGTILADEDATTLCLQTAEKIDAIFRHWRNEYQQLVKRAQDATEKDVRLAIERRAERMHKEYLFSELARRGFTPAYGFPVDVVGFSFLSQRSQKSDADDGNAAQRTLDVAIREYAPGAEIVIDGMVHKSEGLQPAWSAMADASGLEDMRVFWECRNCHQFGTARVFQDIPEKCPQCDAPSTRFQSYTTLRPAGFLGRKAPHTGYESLGYIPYEMSRLSADAPWQALPNPEGGRLRGDSTGRLFTQSSGLHGKGYALCLCCGRADAETEELPHNGGTRLAIPPTLLNHRPLAPLRSEQLQRGLCPGGTTQPNRIQRNLRLAHETCTDVFEFQLPEADQFGPGLALGAGLREALAEKLGAEPREIGIAVSSSQNPVGGYATSVFLYDRAAGGSGLATRLAEPAYFRDCLAIAVTRLDCPEDCAHGCPACILRPDMIFGDIQPDRPAALEHARHILSCLELPPQLAVFGKNTQFVSGSAIEWLERKNISGQLRALTLYVHGRPAEWELAAWSIRDLLQRAQATGARTELVIRQDDLVDTNLEMAQKLDLNRLCDQKTIAIAHTLPVINDMPVLASMDIDGENLAIATSDFRNALPGPGWGMSETAPLIVGPYTNEMVLQRMETAQLIELSSGNAHMIIMGKNAVWPLLQFGGRFWETLCQTDALAMAQLVRHGITRVHYSDRYLLTPLSFRLLWEVLKKIPSNAGDSPNTQVEITTAHIPYNTRSGRFITQSYNNDADRYAVLQALFPKASISIADKSQVPHARSLEITLTNGECLKILLDQGFGAWLTKQKKVYHSFDAPAHEQAQMLCEKQSNVDLVVKEGTPIIIKLERTVS
ncbi:DEAD/DEAH box helicase [Acetobacter senegalensis]|uniref:DEAD/DEAH box helicase n=1 Tax=Acetobacter senegalensis TaxID=446692 RepID=UPI00265046C7|nr:DEAD/DEAH box helicase [Acetobacter senegalensis]MDN7353430.1 DEAD/DEAH box helicase [Acetobacter senegalensis]